MTQAKPVCHLVVGFFCVRSAGAAGQQRSRDAGSDEFAKSKSLPAESELGACGSEARFVKLSGVMDSLQALRVQFVRGFDRVEKTFGKREVREGSNHSARGICMTTPRDAIFALTFQRRDFCC